MQSTN